MTTPTATTPDDLAKVIVQELSDLGRTRITPQRATQLTDLSLKFCYTCSSVKPLEEFPNNRTAKDGKDNRCSACNRKARNSYYTTHRDQEQQRNRERYRAQREASMNDYPRFNKLCPGCHETKDFRQFSCNRSNRDGMDSRCKKCCSEAGKAYRSKDGYAERHNEKQRAYRLSNPWAHRLYAGYHRAKDNGLPADKITRDQLLEHWESIGIDPWVSAYSGKRIPEDQYSIDHIEPLSNPTSKGHVLDNLVPCLLGENSSKKNNHFVHFLGTIHNKKEG